MAAMAKTIRYEMTYDAPVATVAAMLGDPAFREEVCRAQGARKVEVSVAAGADGPGGAKDVRIDQWLPTAGVPSFARRVVGEETNIVQEERWRDATRADLTVAIPGRPGEMGGTAVLAAAGAGSVQTVELTVAVKVPLVGGRLEQLIADLLLKALRTEHRVGRAYLSR